MKTPNKGDILADKITNAIQLYAPIDSRIKAALERALAEYRALWTLDRRRQAVVGEVREGGQMSAEKLNLDLFAELVTVAKERDELRAEVERLKADKARLEFVFEQCKPCLGAPTGRYYQALSRYDLDAAMKGAE